MILIWAACDRSNACKFTPTGGKLVIRTKLVLPHLPRSQESQDSTTAVADDVPKDVEAAAAGDQGHGTSPSLPFQTNCSMGYLHIVADPDATPMSSSPRNQHQPLSINHLIQHDRIHSKATPLEWIVVRMEISDTGCGIRSKDMKTSKLFCKTLPSFECTHHELIRIFLLHSGIQPNRARAPAGWKRHRAGTRPRPTDRQVERRQAWTKVQSQRRLDVLGRASSRRRDQGYPRDESE